MELNEVMNLFGLLRAAGLTPPCDMRNEAERKNLVEGFYNRYKHLDGKAVYYLADKLPQLPRWPRFYDVDELLREHQRKQETDRRYEASKEGRITARNNFLAQCLGRPVGINENWLTAMAKRSASRHFPDADEGLVYENKQVLSAQCEADYICEKCTGKSVKDCPLGGRRMFLEIDQDCGVISQAMSYDKCEKVIASIVPSDDGEVRAIGNRRGGFSSVGEIANNRRN